MGNIRKTITLTDQQDQWIKAQATAGNFADDGEYIRELIRRDQEQHTKFQALKAAIQEGLDSGVSDKTIPVIMEEVEARLRDDGRLPDPMPKLALGLSSRRTNAAGDTNNKRKE